VRALSNDCLVTARTRGGDHERSGVLGELHGETADPAARAVDENAIAWLKIAVLEQRLPGSEAGKTCGTYPARIAASTGLNDVPATSISTSPAPGTGRSTSSYRSTPGPPYS
jgi:hypothetical protein